MLTIEGKLALVTGAATGIGRALALELAAGGANLLLVDINSAGLDETAAAARDRDVRVATCVADLGHATEVRRVAAWVQSDYGRLDILVNNAGVAYYGSTHEMVQEQWQKVVAVNLLAPMQLTHELLPCLFEPLEAHVINMSSICGLVGVSRLAAYNTTKFAIVGFSESLRAEYGPRGIGVTAICPGLVRTGIFDTAMTGGDKTPPRFPRWMTITPERVARRTVRAIRKNQGLVVISTLAHFVWWVKCLFPRFLDRIQRFRRIRRTPMAAPSVAGSTTPSEQPPVRRAA